MLFIISLVLNYPVTVKFVPFGCLHQFPFTPTLLPLFAPKILSFSIRLFI